MDSRQAYREFLGTKFWKELSARKKKQAGKCERCGSRKRLQSHHRFYRERWEDTRIEDLEVLCRGCHQKEHGIKQFRFFPYREDERINAFFHRCHCLSTRLQLGGRLRDRDVRFLKMGLVRFPATKHDTAVEFQVKRILDLDEFIAQHPI
jgi:hypothetical protein